MLLGSGRWLSVESGSHNCTRQSQSALTQQTRLSRCLRVADEFAPAATGLRGTLEPWQCKEADDKLAGNTADHSVDASTPSSEDSTSGASPDVSTRSLEKLPAAVVTPYLTAEVLDCLLGLALCSCAPAGHWLRQLGLFLQTLAAAGPQLSEGDKAVLRRAAAACPQPSDTLSRTLSTCCSALAGG
ncbi:hypothetical protein DIPPA_34981 [Diplonema papillatum]|nr:hypothetical protein DIPPA_34981 [Diplonema papillatum]